MQQPVKPAIVSDISIKEAKRAAMGVVGRDASAGRAWVNGRLVIRGGKPLRGEVTVSSSKNSAVAVLAAALLSDGICVVDNVPLIDDVFVLKAMIEQLGATAEIKGHSMRIDSSTVNVHKAPQELVRKMRASYYLIGALLGRLGRAQVAMPGGCDIGSRPMDQHVKGLRALGAKMDLVRGEYVCSVDSGRMRGAEVYLDMASVGATINIMLASVRAKGTTVIVNAAREPHVVDVANFLNAMGARVKGAGTDIIRVTGVDSMHGCRYSILPDMIEAGTWMCIACGTKGDITIRNCVPYHMESVSAKLVEMGACVEEGEDYLRVSYGGSLRAVNVRTHYYPGFPTDLQQPIAVLCAVAKGRSVITENIYESRYKYIEEIARMGARVSVMDRTAFVEGVDALWGTTVRATDLRAGAALVVAGLVAEGTTIITDAYHIDRGYEYLPAKLKALGADIEF